MSKKKKEKTEDEIKDENDFLKMSLMAEYGGDFIGGGDLPPMVENHFLKQIKDFHKKQSKAEPKKVFEIINEPEYDHTADLSDKEIKVRLQKLQNKLMAKGIFVSSIMPVAEREMYRFITEEVFKTVVHFAKGTNIVLNILYEEYYPSDEAEVKVIANDLVQFIFDGSVVFIDQDLFADQLKDSYNLIVERNDLIAKIDLFKIQFKVLTIEDIFFTYMEVDKDEHFAKMNIEVLYKCRKSNRGRFKNLETEIYLEFDHNEETDTWQISKISCSEIFDKIN